MPRRPLFALHALAACTGDNASSVDDTTETDTIARDLLTTGTMSGGMGNRR